MSKRYILAALLAVAPGQAHAEPVVLDSGGVAFFFIIAVITGAVAWWRHTRGDHLPAVAVWSAMLLAMFMVTRYGPGDTWSFVTRMLGA